MPTIPGLFLNVIGWFHPKCDRLPVAIVLLSALEREKIEMPLQLSIWYYTEHRIVADPS